jgi:hypothetical protein
VPSSARFRRALTLLTTIGVIAGPAVTFAAAPAASHEPKYAATTFDPQVELTDFSSTFERAAVTDTLRYQTLLRRISLRNQAASLQMQLHDPARSYPDLCGNGMDGCAGDVRLYDWQTKHYGIVRPFLFTARDGSSTVPSTR